MTLYVSDNPTVNLLPPSQPYVRTVFQYDELVLPLLSPISRYTTGQSVQMKKTVLSYATTHLGTLTHLEDCSQTLYTTFVWQQTQMGERVRALECKKAPHLEVKKLLTHSDSFTCAAIKHPLCTCYSVPTWDCQCESNCRPGHPENNDHQLFSDHLRTTEVNNTIYAYSFVCSDRACMLKHSQQYCIQL